MSESQKARRTTVILNPAAGRGQGARCRAQLKTLLHGTELLVTNAAGDAETLAADCAARGANLIVAAGGDGTLSEVLNGVLQSKKSPRLGIIPIGTGNDFSRCLGVPRDINAAVDLLVHGTPRRVDVGQVTFENGVARYFLNIAGCGFDSAVAQRVNDFRTRRVWRHIRGTPAYLCAVLQELCGLRVAQLKITCDETVLETRAVLCAIANATSYGGGMLVAPNAQLDDGQFDLCLIGDAGRWEFLRAFPGVFKGTHVSHPKVTTKRGREIFIESTLPLPVLVDGDILGTTPAHFQILPSAIEIMAP
jgi:diacylglycerol kinase (ATP)